MKISVHKVEIVPIDSLKPHPGNYRAHGEDQLAHIKHSIKKNGQYKNIVIAKDSTILGGHGVWEACKALEMTEVSVARLNIKPGDVAAMKILTGDNESSKLGIVDDRLLSEILKDISMDVEGLLGTGFDEKQLANLVFVTRDSNELKDFSAAAEWVGLPSYEERDDTKNKLPIIEIKFKNAEDREQFAKQIDLRIKSKIGDRKWSTTWPFEERNDVKSVKFKVKKK